MKKTKGRMRGILSLVLALLLMVTMIPAQKVLAEGGSGGEENPPQPPKPPVSQGIEFVLEGNARDKFGEMIAAGNDANNIYVKVNEDTSYQKINDLIKSKMVTVSQDGRYQFADSVKKVSLYVKYDANYMVQFMPNVAGIGFSENAPLVLDGSGSQHIQIDKKVNTITWAYDDVRYGKDAYLEHGTAEIIAVNGTPVAQLPKDPDNFAANAGNKDGGHFAADPGAKITIKLTPDYGYQLSGVQLNGGATLEAQKDVSTFTFATVYKGNIIKNLIMDCQSYAKYRPNETTGGIFVSWRRKEELPTGA